MENGREGRLLDIDNSPAAYVRDSEAGGSCKGGAGDRGVIGCGDGNGRNKRSAF